MSFRRVAPGTPPAVAPRRALASVAALAIALGALVVGPGAVAPAGAAPTTIAVTAKADLAEAQLLWLINADRARVGLRPLAMHGVLADGSTAWSRWMAAHGYLFHHPDLRSVARQAQPSGWSAIAENVGAGPDGIRLHQQFMASRVHAGNVYGSYTSIGIGAVESAGRIWVTVRFLR